MVFVYLLAVIGLAALVGITAWVVRVWWEVPAAPPTDDPYDEALMATARLQARAWEAAQELGQLDREAER